MTKEFAPYINFPGTAREALEFYQQVFGGEIDATTYGQFNVVPAGNPAADKIMHAALRSELVLLFASDAVPEAGAPASTPGNNVTLAVMIDDPELGRTIFDALGVGGQVEMPYEKQMWGDMYGAVTDKFGIPWMVDSSDPNEPQA